MKKLEIQHSRNHDWFVVYIDDLCFDAGHSISLDTWLYILKELNIPIKVIEKDFE